MNFKFCKVIKGTSLNLMTTILKYEEHNPKCLGRQALLDELTVPSL